MADIPPGFSFAETDDGFILREKKPDGTVTEIRMTPTGLNALKATIDLWQDRKLLERRVEGGTVEPIIAHQIERIGLIPDALQANVVMTVQTPSGSQMSLSLPLELADWLAAELPRFLAGLSHPTKQ
jgi:hypothetical protein